MGQPCLALHDSMSRRYFALLFTCSLYAGSGCGGANRERAASFGRRAAPLVQPLHAGEAPEAFTKAPDLMNMYAYTRGLYIRLKLIHWLFEGQMTQGALCYFMNDMCFLF